MFRKPNDRIVAKIIFPTADMAASIEFYRSLGLEVVSYDDGYAWVRHDGEEVLHLARVDGLDLDANRAAGYWHVQDADHWFDRLAAGSPSPVVDQPWGMREFSLHDPSGNLLRVGQNR